MAYRSRTTGRFVSKRAYARWKSTGKIVDTTRVRAGRRGQARRREETRLAAKIVREQKVSKKKAAAVAKRKVRRAVEKERVALAEVKGRIAPGRLVEVAIATRGGWYRRREGRRMKRKHETPLYVKIGVRATAPATLEEFERAVRQTTERGVVPPGFALSYCDWEKGEGTALRRGQITAKLAVELQNFYGAAHHKDATVRADLVAAD